MGFVQASNEFKQAEFRRVEFVAHPPVGCPYEDVLKPEFWAHVADRTPIHAEITVHPEEGHYYAKLLVVYKAPHTLKVRQIQYVDFIEPGDVGVDLDADEDIYVKYCGPVALWRVMRRSDNKVLAEKLTDRASAEKEMATYRTSLAA